MDENKPEVEVGDRVLIMSSDVPGPSIFREGTVTKVYNNIDDTLTLYPGIVQGVEVEFDNVGLFNRKVRRAYSIYDVWGKVYGRK